MYIQCRRSRSEKRRVFILRATDSYKEKAAAKTREKKIEKRAKFDEKMEKKRREEMEAAKVKKGAEMVEKAAAKAKEKIEKRTKFDENMLDESDKQMAADLEQGEYLFLEQQRHREEKAKRMMEKNAKTEMTIKVLTEKLERKVVNLREQRESSGRHATMMAVYKLNFKTENLRTSGIRKVIEKPNKKVNARKEEIKRLFPQLLETVVTSQPEQDAEPSSPNCDIAGLESEAVDTNDDQSVLEMLFDVDLDSEGSDDEDDELTSGKVIRLA